MPVQSWIYSLHKSYLTVAVLNQWNAPLEWNGGMEWWNGHFNHFLMDGGKGRSREQYIRITLHSRSS